MKRSFIHCSSDRLQVHLSSPILLEGDHAATPSSTLSVTRNMSEQIVRVFINTCSPVSSLCVLRNRRRNPAASMHCWHVCAQLKPQEATKSQYPSMVLHRISISHPSDKVSRTDHRRPMGCPRMVYQRRMAINLPRRDQCSPCYRRSRMQDVLNTRLRPQPRPRTRHLGINLQMRISSLLRLRDRSTSHRDKATPIPIRKTADL